MESQHLARLNFTPGTLGSTSLLPQLNKRGEVVRLEWQPAVTQREGQFGLALCVLVPERGLLKLDGNVTAS